LSRAQLYNSCGLFDAINDSSRVIGRHLVGEFLSSPVIWKIAIHLIHHVLAEADPSSSFGNLGIYGEAIILSLTRTNRYSPLKIIVVWPKELRGRGRGTGREGPHCRGGGEGEGRVVG